MKPYTFCKKSIPIALAILTTLAFTACRKDNPHLFRDKGWKPGNPLVFVAGYDWDGVKNEAKCWIDDEELTLPAQTNDAMANSIFVAGNDAYIAGNDGMAVYWKNLTEIVLPFKSNSFANSIYVSGGHIYVAGIDGNNAAYWKDGVEIILNTTNVYGQFDHARGNSISISGNDIYVAGKDGPNAVYWKNGVEVYLTNFDKDVISTIDEEANSIDVSGGNVYVVGSEYVLGALSTRQKFWTTGMGLILNHSNFEYETGTNSVFVSGNNVYISGNGYNSSSASNSALYWKNGNVTVLTGNSINSFSSDVYAKGNDIYVSGFESANNHTYALYWKNGTVVKLTDGIKYAVANSIFVK